MNETEEEDEVHEEVRVLKDHFQQLRDQIENLRKDHSQQLRNQDLKNKTEIENLRKELEKLKRVVKEKDDDWERETSYGKCRF